MEKKRIGLNIKWLLLVFLLLQGCATVMQGSTQQISVSSKPTGANLLVNGFQRLRTPAVVELSRKESHRIEISHEGYHPETVEITKVSSSMTAGNIIAGGLIGWAVDHSSGAAFRLVPEVIQVDLRPIEPEPPKVSALSSESETKVEEKKAE